MIEIREIEENYFVGTDGNVYKKLSPSKNGKYLYFSSKNKKHYAVHRAVAEAFCYQQEGKTDVNHKDGNTLNNVPENLEWVTKKENMHHQFYELGKTPVRNYKKCDLYIDDIFHKEFNCISECLTYAKQLSYSHTMLSKHKRHKNARIVVKESVTTIPKGSKVED